MGDNLGKRIDALAQTAPDGTPDVDSVVTRGRRVRTRRLIERAVGSITGAAVLLIGITTLDFSVRDTAPPRPAAHEDGLFVPARPGEPTYVLTDVRISHPYLDRNCVRRGGTRADCTMSDHVRVAYGWRWSTNRYPGIVQCRIRLFAGQRIVGHAHWELSGLEPTSRRPLDHAVDFAGDDVPDRAEAGCEAGSYEGGPGYRFTFVRAEDYTTFSTSGKEISRLRLFFDVEVLQDHAPDTRKCRSTVVFDSGRTHTGTFTMTGAPRNEMHFEVPYDPGEGLEDASVKCRPYIRP